MLHGELEGVVSIVSGWRESRELREMSAQVLQKNGEEGLGKYYALVAIWKATRDPGKSNFH